MTAPLAGAETPERVRACLACGELVPFASRVCPVCGHVEVLQAPSESVTPVACAGCGAAMTPELLFCPRCGRERGAATLRAGARSVLQDGSARALDVLGVVLALLGPLTLGVAAWLMNATGH